MMQSLAEEGIDRRRLGVARSFSKEVGRGSRTTRAGYTTAQYTLFAIIVSCVVVRVLIIVYKSDIEGDDLWLIIWVLTTP